MGFVDVVVGRPDRIAIYAGIVDQCIEAAGVRLDPLSRREDRVLVGDVEVDRLDPVAPLDLIGIPRAGVDEEAVISGELERNLSADPAVRPADQGDRAQILFRSSSFLPITIRWISEVPSPISRSGASR